jgi:hypothetical protein
MYHGVGGINARIKSRAKVLVDINQFQLSS